MGGDLEEDEGAFGNWIPHGGGLRGQRGMGGMGGDIAGRRAAQQVNTALAMELWGVPIHRDGILCARNLTWLHISPASFAPASLLLALCTDTRAA